MIDTDTTELVLDPCTGSSVRLAEMSFVYIPLLRHEKIIAYTENN